jgi:hypothetical protein
MARCDRGASARNVPHPGVRFVVFHATVNTIGIGLVFPLFKGPTFFVFWYVYASLDSQSRPERRKAGD